MLAKIEELDERVAQGRRHRHRAAQSNQGAQFVRHLQNMLVLARVIAQGARNRDESRGAHFKPEFPKRDDDELAAHDARLPRGGERTGTTACEYVRELDYALAGKPVHVTDAVDTSLVRAARAQVRDGGRRERRGDGQADPRTISRRARDMAEKSGRRARTAADSFT